MSETITYLPDIRTTPTPETPLERGLFTYDALAGFGGPESYMEHRGRFILACFAGPRMGGFTADDVLRELALDCTRMSVHYTPENPLKVGSFRYDGGDISGPSIYMEACGLALLEAEWAAWDNATWMRDALEALQSDYAAYKRRMKRFNSLDKPIPADTRFVLRAGCWRRARGVGARHVSACARAAPADAAAGTQGTGGQ